MKKPTRKKLTQKIDELRRDMVRLRDKDWKDWAYCISCGAYKPISDLQAGHFYLRQYDFTTLLLTEYRNVNLQCQQCNGFKHGNLAGYAVGLQRKYGKKILFELEKKYKTPHYWKYTELLDVVEELKKLNEH